MEVGRVDVVTEIDIDRPAADVAVYAADPTNAAQWHANIEWRASGPNHPCESAIGFVARCLV